MKDNFIVKEYRGSIFTTQQIFKNSDLIRKLSELLEISNPTIIEKSSNNNVGEDLEQFKDWCLISKDNALQINFQAQKIDFMQKIETIYSPMTLGVFSDLCKTVFKEIISFVPQNVTRLAIAPSFKYNGNSEELAVKINTFFSKNNFLEEHNDKIDFSQVYRHVEHIGGKDIMLNYFSKFYVSNELKIEKGHFDISSEVVLDFDINTYMGSNYSFSIDDILSFYDQGTMFCTKFIDYYYED